MCVQRHFICRFLTSGTKAFHTLLLQIVWLIHFLLFRLHPVGRCRSRQTVPGRKMQDFKREKAVGRQLTKGTFLMFRYWFWNLRWSPSDHFLLSQILFLAETKAAAAIFRSDESVQKQETAWTMHLSRNVWKAFVLDVRRGQMECLCTNIWFRRYIHSKLWSKWAKHGDAVSCFWTSACRKPPLSDFVSSRKIRIFNSENPPAANLTGFVVL